MVYIFDTDGAPFLCCTVLVIAELVNRHNSHRKKYTRMLPNLLQCVCMC